MSTIENHYVSAISKKLRNITKKRERILQTEAKRLAGEVLNSDQLALIETKPVIEKVYQEVLSISKLIEEIAITEANTPVEISAPAPAPIQAPFSDSSSARPKTLRKSEIVASNETPLDSTGISTIPTTESFKLLPLPISSTNTTSSTSSNSSLALSNSSVSWENAIGKLLACLHINRCYSDITGKKLPDSVDYFVSTLLGLTSISNFNETLLSSLKVTINFILNNQNSELLGGINYNNLNTIIQDLYLEMNAAIENKKSEEKKSKESQDSGLENNAEHDIKKNIICNFFKNTINPSNSTSSSVSTTSTTSIPPTPAPVGSFSAPDALVFPASSSSTLSSSLSASPLLSNYYSNSSHIIPPVPSFSALPLNDLLLSGQSVGQFSQSSTSQFLNFNTAPLNLYDGLDINFDLSNATPAPAPIVPPSLGLLASSTSSSVPAPAPAPSPSPSPAPAPPSRPAAPAPAPAPAPIMSASSSNPTLVSLAKTSINSSISSSIASSLLHDIISDVSNIKELNNNIQISEISHNQAEIQETEAIIQEEKLSDTQEEKLNNIQEEKPNNKEKKSNNKKNRNNKKNNEIDIPNSITSNDLPSISQNLSELKETKKNHQKKNKTFKDVNSKPQEETQKSFAAALSAGLTPTLAPEVPETSVPEKKVKKNPKQNNNSTDITIVTNKNINSAINSVDDVKSKSNNNRNKKSPILPQENQEKKNIEKKFEKNTEKLKSNQVKKIQEK